jgi:hypothetical protein
MSGSSLWMPRSADWYCGNRFRRATRGQQRIGQAQAVVGGGGILEGLLRGTQLAGRIEHLLHPAHQSVAMARVAHGRQPDRQRVHQAAQPGECKQDHQPIALPARCARRAWQRRSR